MDVDNILTLVIKHMTSVENIIKLKGDEKKEIVINLLQKQLPNYSDYAELIPVIIELVIILSRQIIPINLKKFNCWGK
jgi:hypothetical protein